MAYNKKIWTNRTSEYPNRYRMTSANGNIADVAIVPNEGNVTAEGDKFSADTMNDMETRIKNGFDSADSSISSLNTTLRGLITNEQTRAVGVENLLQADLNTLSANLQNEVTRATGAEGTLTTNLANEVSRAQGVESGHNTRITALEGRVDNAESDIDTLESAIAGVQTSLDTEVTRATNAESTLTTNLQAETTRATNVENVLDTRVTTLETITTRAYKASGSVYFIDLPAAVKIRQGNVYDILDAFTTTSEFLEGPGKEYPAHTDVVIVGVEGDYYNEVTPSGDENPSEEGWYVYDSTEEEYVLTEDTSVQSGTTYYSYANVKYMYNIGTGFFDTSNFVQKTDYATLLAAGIVKPDGTTTSIDVDGTIHSLGGGQGTAEAAERMIAPIEPDATASTREYVIGAKLILNEVLYKAKTAIEIGDALVIGTNIEVSDDVGTELQKSYKTDDSASTTINDTDYVPMSESGGTKKKTLWSTIVAKIKSALGKSDVGLGNVANLDQSKAIKSITRSGTTFTATALDGTTSTFTQQDNNTTYSAGTGLSLSSGAFSVNYGTTAGTACQGNDSRLSNSRTPTSHASTGTGYGAGNASNYGHVKLTDSYNDSTYHPAASNGVAASAQAVFGVYAMYGHYESSSFTVTNKHSNVTVSSYACYRNSHLLHVEFMLAISASISHQTKIFDLNVGEEVLGMGGEGYLTIGFNAGTGTTAGAITYYANAGSKVNSFAVRTYGGLAAGDYIRFSTTMIRPPKAT